MTEPMIFTPAPPNDFRHFIETYYTACRNRAPYIEAIAGKWRFEDLIPGMSDFDTRLICANGMTADDWCRMSTAVGQVHLDLCRSHPQWARILEHLPGINLTWNEWMDEAAYIPSTNSGPFTTPHVPICLPKAGSDLQTGPGTQPMNTSI